MDTERDGKTKTTIRMRRAPDQTLHGYIFSDDAHAREWLANTNPADVKLERVAVGELKRCHCCGGTGYRQAVKKICDIALDELLRDKGPAHPASTG